MELQYVFDSAGNCTAVIVPIEKWVEIISLHPDLKEIAGTLSEKAREKMKKEIERLK